MFVNYENCNEKNIFVLHSLPLILGETNRKQADTTYTHTHSSLPSVPRTLDLYIDVRPTAPQTTKTVVRMA